MPAHRTKLCGWLSSLLISAVPASVEGADPPPRCFDFADTIVEPLQPPIPMVSGRDNSTFGTRPGGVVWASTRARIAKPIAAVYAKLRDHRNHKDMKKTRLTTTELRRPGYLDFQRVDVLVTVRALLLPVKLPWTEEWGFSLIEGTPDAPRKILASYQKVRSRTKHLRHQCGSYVLQALDDGSSDLSMYDEVIASHRSAEDTRKMQAGILANLRRQEPGRRPTSRRGTSAPPAQ
jgi:hypothetical protein